MGSVYSSIYRNALLYHSLQLCLRLRHSLNVLELVEEIQALRVQQRPAGLDILTRDDVFDRQLDLLAVDSDLCHIVSLV